MEMYGGKRGKRKIYRKYHPIYYISKKMVLGFSSYIAQKKKCKKTKLICVLVRNIKMDMIALISTDFAWRRKRWI